MVFEGHLDFRLKHDPWFNMPPPKSPNSCEYYAEGSIGDLKIIIKLPDLPQGPGKYKVSVVLEID